MGPRFLILQMPSVFPPPVFFLPSILSPLLLSFLFGEIEGNFPQYLPSIESQLFSLNLDSLVPKRATSEWFVDESLLPFLQKGGKAGRWS